MSGSHTAFLVLGFGCIGAVIGWLVSIATQFAPAFSPKWLAGMVGAICGGAVVKLIGGSEDHVAAYGIGLFILFAARTALVGSRPDSVPGPRAMWEVRDRQSDEPDPLYQGTKRECNSWVRKQSDATRYSVRERPRRA